jgi:hypothetical protein
MPEKILIIQTKKWHTTSVAAYRKIGDNRNEHTSDKETDRVKDGWKGNETQSKLWSARKRVYVRCQRSGPKEIKKKHHLWA